MEKEIDIVRRGGKVELHYYQQKVVCDADSLQIIKRGCSNFPTIIDWGRKLKILYNRQNADTNKLWLTHNPSNATDTEQVDEKELFVILLRPKVRSAVKKIMPPLIRWHHEDKEFFGKKGEVYMIFPCIDRYFP